MSGRDDDTADEAEWGAADPAAPPGSDLDGDDDSEAVPCPHCGRPVYEDADRCPHCGDYVLPGRAPATRRPWWFVAVVAVTVLLLAAWLLGPCPR